MVNWRKGLLRFWIVISTFWIISIVVLNIGEYNQASKKESRLKYIVAEIKNPTKALDKIREEFPELRQQYGFQDLGPIFGPPIEEKEKHKTSMFGPPVQPSKEELKKLSNEELLKMVNKPKDETIYKGILIEICRKAETDRRDKLYGILLISFIPPILLLICGASIYWALRGFIT